jgi:subtilisin-like proprotein convertase family protein
VELSDRLVVQLANPASLPHLMAGTGLAISRKVTESILILEAGSAWKAAQEAQRLAQTAGVVAAYPVLRREGALHGPYYRYPSDKAFFQLWPLENRNADGSQAGPDLDVRAAWPLTLGAGVTVSVDDIGVELRHQELSNNAAGAPHYNFILGTTNGNPVNRGASGAHGTEVAGLLASGINNFRMVGVAPEAHLASCVIFSSNFVVAADDQLMDAYEYQSNVIQVQNHSWGVAGTYPGQFAPTLLEEVGISNAIAKGRGGLGTILVRSGGDGRAIQQDANDSGYSSDPRVIAVGAVLPNGQVASYSDPGACLLVAAPSGDPASGVNPLFTTDLIGTDGANQLNFLPPNQDLNDYVFNGLGFTGTSASAPQVSGVVALMLSINSQLGWRDVQHILALSSRHFDFADPDVTTNGAGFVVSDNLGYGTPDAGIAVLLAQRWTNLEPVTNVTLTSTEVQSIPPSGLNVDLSAAGVELTSVVALPDLGAHADNPTPLLPLVDVGLATNAITVDLTNKGALIERGTNSYLQKLTYAAQAGAAFAVVYNYPADTNLSGAPGGDELFVMGQTDFVPIPAVFIGNTDGENLKDVMSLYPNALAQIRLTSATYTFTVTNTLLCEHAAVELMADNQIRGNLRITLTSPAGTRSVLDRYNSDTSPGPADWTYYTTHCFYENSAGLWTVSVTDEGEGNFGQVNSVSLTISGRTTVGTLSGARQQILESYLSPNPSQPIPANLSIWNSSLARLSWIGDSTTSYQIWSGTNASTLTFLTNISGVFPVTEWFPSYQSPQTQFYAVKPAP